MRHSHLVRRLASLGIWLGALSLLTHPGEGQTSGDTQSTGTASRSLSSAISPPAVSPTYVPITEHERWHGYLKSLVSPGAALGSAAIAGINQWTNTPSEWGQGAAGYGCRFASSCGLHVVRQTIQTGGAALLHEDTRYIPSGETGFVPRLKYALTSTVTARSRDGSRHLSAPVIGGFVGAAFISRAWQPPSRSHPDDAISALGVSMGLAATKNVVREFCPRMFHLWRH
jgi:hypothetical protein